MSEVIDEGPHSDEEPHCDTASELVAQLPLAMVATLIPSKQVSMYEIKV